MPDDYLHLIVPTVDVLEILLVYEFKLNLRSGNEKSQVGSPVSLPEYHTLEHMALLFLITREITAWNINTGQFSYRSNCLK